jgi:ADP-dependent phosphofructokinase/glucokinase
MDIKHETYGSGEEVLHLLRTATAIVGLYRIGKDMYILYMRTHKRPKMVEVKNIEDIKKKLTEVMSSIGLTEQELTSIIDILGKVI